MDLQSPSAIKPDVSRLDSEPSQPDAHDTEAVNSCVNDAPFCIGQTSARTRGQLWADAASLAGQLPERAYVLNLCEDRYLFCLTLLAALCRRQVSLLPPSGQAGVLRQILSEFPDSYLAFDQHLTEPPDTAFKVAAPDAAGTAFAPVFDPQQAAVIALTSGSTGHPKACHHSFVTFQTSAAMALASLGLEDERAVVVSTTPPQHMYGLETSIFWPLFSSLSLYPGRPFFPEDIRRTVQTSPLPCILASTPTHLSALLRTTGEWTNLRAILCSTSNLSTDLARQVEAACGAPVLEIYGSTETLSIAMRHTVRDKAWRPYAGISLLHDGAHQTCVVSPHLARPTFLGDRLAVEPDGRFTLLGRAGDMIKIGGKRGSLNDLNSRLATIDGIRDGLFHPYEDPLGESRLAAVVVGEASKADIVSALRPYLDEVFLPRRIHYVTAIPRNQTGKVTKEEWSALLVTLGYDSA